MKKAKTVTKELTKKNRDLPAAREVAKKELAETEPLRTAGNLIHEIQVKHLFLSQAITALWGDSQSICSDEVVFGCQLLMHDVSKDLKELERSLDRG